MAKAGRESFENVLSQIRSDLEHVDNLFALLKQKLVGRSLVDTDTRIWMFDTFLDKLYETNAKAKKFVTSIFEAGPNIDFRNMDQSLAIVKMRSEKVAFGGNAWTEIYALQRELRDYKQAVEDVLSGARWQLHELGWETVKAVDGTEYIIEHRRKFVTAREELEKAVQASRDGAWEEVMNHLRSAIDLALKEKFGFRKIINMKAFVEEAQRLDLTLPSYDSLYYYYNMGSQRLHSGIVNPPFEAREALRFVSDFIDALDLIEPKPEVLENFRKNSKTTQ